MEGLLCILIELIAAPLAILTALADGVLLGALTSLASVILNLGLGLIRVLSGRPAYTGKTAVTAPTAGASPSSMPPARSNRRWVRWMLIGSLGLLGLVSVALLVINTWFVDDLLRMALARQEQQSGIHVECAHINASLLSGHCELSDVRVTRHDHPAGEIDLTVRTVAVSMSLWSAWEPTVPIRSLRIDGLRGRYDLGRPRQPGDTEPVTSDERRTSPDLDRAPRRQFAIAELEITDLAAEVTDHTRRTPLHLPLTITRMTAAPLRSSWALFDVLFRSNASGALAGRPFTIATNDDNDGRQTIWSVSELPVEVLTTLIGGPFSLLTQGRCDIQVTDRWQLGGETLIDMDWKLTLHDVHAEVPEGLAGLKRTLAIPVVALVNASPAQLPLGFTVHLDRKRFEGATTLEAAGLWQAVDEALTRTLAEKTGIAPEKLDQLQKGAVEVGKDLLERWRKSKK